MVFGVVMEGRGLKDTGWFGGKSVISVEKREGVKTNNLTPQDPYLKFRIINPGNVKGEKFKTLVCRKAGSNPDWRGEYHSFRVTGNLNLPCLIAESLLLILPSFQEERSPSMWKHGILTR